MLQNKRENDMMYMPDKLHGGYYKIIWQHLFSLYLIVVIPKLLLKMVDNVLVNLEGLSKDIRVDGRVRTEHSICNGDHSSILAAESSKGNCWCVSFVELEMNQTNGEHEHISLVQNLREEAVFAIFLVGCHKPNVECSLISVPRGVIYCYTEILKRTRILGRGNG
ncbi:hypothetical protein F8388_010718 [Cannabis sativa]|uniref:Uncharacterized protein n=1 Tax=Cannabis sativa TaxID=3483 RepID=A0A7J6G851_CANSA|nr:hypothetical protein F8388_010718 [Cannabis sativa]